MDDGRVQSGRWDSRRRQAQWTSTHYTTVVLPRLIRVQSLCLQLVNNLPLAGTTTRRLCPRLSHLGFGDFISFGVQRQSAPVFSFSDFASTVPKIDQYQTSGNYDQYERRNHKREFRSLGRQNVVNSNSLNDIFRDDWENLSKEMRWRKRLGDKLRGSSGT